MEIFSQQQQDLLVLIIELSDNILGRCSPWIGLTNIAHNPNNWVWVHSLMNSNFTSWVSGHPSTTNDYNFALMGWGDDYNWYDIDAEYISCSICQFFP